MVALATLLALACADGADGGESQVTQQGWLIGIYLAADNNLDGAATNDINEILRGGVPENVTVLVLVEPKSRSLRLDTPWIQPRAPTPRTQERSRMRPTLRRTFSRARTRHGSRS